MPIQTDVYTHMQKSFPKSNLKEAIKNASQLANTYPLPHIQVVGMYPSGGQAQF